MTILEKNEAIAKLIYWTIKRHGLGYFFWEKPGGIKLPAFKPLVFDTDANWQFEAIDFIEKMKDEPGYSWIVDTYMQSCQISNTHNFSPIICINDNSRKEAIFEALYQFSQYLKTKK